MLPEKLTAISLREEIEKFERVYQKERAFMFYVAKLVLKGDSMAEDAVQEAAIRLFRNIGKVDEQAESLTRGYLAAITRHVAFDMLKKYQKVELLSEEEMQITLQKETTRDLVVRVCSDPEEQILRMEHGVEVKHILSQLKNAHQEILYLVYFKEMATGKVAEVLGISETAARKRLQRAREEFIKFYQKSLENPVTK